MTDFIELLKDKKHIVWDWNGTLLNDVDHAVSTMNQILAEHQLTPLVAQSYRQIFEFPVVNYYRALGFDFSVVPFEDLCHRFVGDFMNGFRTLPLVTGMQQLLQSLYDDGKKQSILSATDQASLDEMIDHFEIRHFFEFVFGIDNKLAGSKLQHGHQLLNLSGIQKSQTVLEGDTLHDLEVGTFLGIEVVLVGHGHQCAKKLSKYHDKVVQLEPIFANKNID